MCNIVQFNIISIQVQNGILYNLINIQSKQYNGPKMDPWGTPIETWLQ